MAKAETILTGLRANGELHLGSYLGAMQPMARLQQRLGPQDKLYMFVPDLHTFTTPIGHSTLYDNIIQNVRMFIAGGIDPMHTRTFLYRQSRVSAHAELTWILNCFAYYGELNRMTEFKDKSAKLGNKEVSAALFDYPVLMAADILLYDAEYVPLGDDQKQHMELIRKLAQRMNKKFGNLFAVPKPWDEQLKFSQRDISVRIRSLSNPVNKMSKSIEDPSGTINLSDDPEDAAQKIIRAETDSKQKINLAFDSQPGISNLLQIGGLLMGEAVHTYAKKWQAKSNYKDLKAEVASIVKQFLTGFQSEFSKTSVKAAENILKAGEKAATGVAKAKLANVQKAVGLLK